MRPSSPPRASAFAAASAYSRLSAQPTLPLPALVTQGAPAAAAWMAGSSFSRYQLLRRMANGTPEPVIAFSAAWCGGARGSRVAPALARLVYAMNRTPARTAASTAFVCCRMRVSLSPSVEMIKMRSMPANARSRLAGSSKLPWRTSTPRARKCSAFSGWRTLTASLSAGTALSSDSTTRPPSFPVAPVTNHFIRDLLRFAKRFRLASGGADRPPFFHFTPGGRGRKRRADGDRRRPVRLVPLRRRAVYNGTGTHRRPGGPGRLAGQSAGRKQRTSEAMDDGCGTGRGTGETVGGGKREHRLFRRSGNVDGQRHPGFPVGGRAVRRNRHRGAAGSDFEP